MTAVKEESESALLDKYMYTYKESMYVKNCLPLIDITQ